MSDMRQALVDNAARLFADLCTHDVFASAEKGALDDGVWQALHETGLTSATVSEARGGAGADLGDALAVVREAGAASLPAPLVESLIAERVLAAAGLPPQARLVAVGPALPSDRLVLTREDGVWTLSGTLRRVAWARHAAAIVVIAQCEGRDVTAVAATPEAIEAANIAKEPRDTIHFRAQRIADDDVGAPAHGMSRDDLHFEGALFRCAAMAGALSKVLELTVAYAKQRVQFGRPIGNFQAVQHNIAVLASQVAAASAAADAVIEAATNGPARFEIAAAKTRIGEAAGIVAGLAHQIHGAMGFSHEYSLHRSTRRLWSWRDEFGSEHEWAQWLGRAAARVGGKELWPLLTSPSEHLAAAANRPRAAR